MHLSTKALLRACLIVAKIQLLSCEHPAAVRLAVAKSLAHGTWWHQVGEASADGAFLYIENAGFCPLETLEQARLDGATRRNLLKLYKLPVLIPAPQAMDDAAIRKVATKFLVGLGCVFCSLCSERRLYDSSRLLPVLQDWEWKLARLSAFARLPGLWSLGLPFASKRETFGQGMLFAIAQARQHRSCSRDLSYKPVGMQMQISCCTFCSIRL